VHYVAGEYLEMLLTPAGADLIYKGETVHQIAKEPKDKAYRFGCSTFAKGSGFTDLVYRVHDPKSGPAWTRDGITLSNCGSTDDNTCAAGSMVKNEESGWNNRVWDNKQCCHDCACTGARWKVKGSFTYCGFVAFNGPSGTQKDGDDAYLDYGFQVENWRTATPTPAPTATPTPAPTPTSTPFTEAATACLSVATLGRYLSVAAALGPLEAATVSEKDSSDFLANNRRRLAGYHGGNKRGLNGECSGEEQRDSWDSEERKECFEAGGMKCDYGYWRKGQDCKKCPGKSQLYIIFPSCYLNIPTFLRFT
jgi:hypothetical protein